MPDGRTRMVWWVGWSALLLGGCSSTGWTPTHSKALQTAATDWRTWAPIVAGIAIDAADLDHDISDEFADGDTDAAERASDALLRGSVLGALTVSGVESARYQSWDPFVGTVSTGVANEALNRPFKALWHRRRPNGENHLSFYSGHTSHTAWSAASLRYALKRSRVRRDVRPWLDGALTLLPVATGALRVSARKHYPSDVLVGWGAGNFFGTFFGELEHDRWLRTRVRPNVSLRRTHGDATLRVGVTVDF